LDYGHSLMFLLRQEKNRPMKQHEQIILLTAALNHVIQEVPDVEISKFKYGLIDHIESKAPHIYGDIKAGNLDENIKEDIVRLGREYFSLTYGGGE
jgi:F-type H+-transporting ATPase subunit alpha